MNIDKAKAQLERLRKRQRGLRKKIDALRGFLRSNGINPDAPATNLQQRNKAIYGRRLDGCTYTRIGKEFGLSPGRVSSICGREAVRAEKGARPGTT